MFKEPGNSSATERRDDFKKLRQFVETTAAKYCRENVPLGDDGRIDMRSYASMYSDVDNDCKRNREWEEIWHKENPQSRAQEQSETDGEKLEILAYAIFVKNLGERFIVARASPHDDRVNKVDTILLDRETGNLVCAFDEVGDTTGADYERKQSTVQSHNLQGGASLKYGLGIVMENGHGKVVPSAASNIPIFYIALPKDRIEKGIKAFLPALEQQSDFEEKLFVYFTATITAQIHALELYSKRLDTNLQKKLTAFKTVIHGLHSKRKKSDT